MNTHQVHNCLFYAISLIQTRRPLFLISQDHEYEQITQNGSCFSSQIFASRFPAWRNMFVFFFFVTTRQLWVQPTVYLSSFSAAESAITVIIDDDDGDDVLFFSAWVHWLECSVRWRRFFFPKEKLKRNIENSLEKTEKLRCTVSPADIEKKKVSQKTGEVLDVCGTSQRNLLPWLFVVGHSRTCGKTCRKLWNQTDFFVRVCCSVALGTSRHAWDDERRDRVGMYCGLSSCRYSGAVPS